MEHSTTEKLRHLLQLVGRGLKFIRWTLEYAGLPEYNGKVDIYRIVNGI